MIVSRSGEIARPCSSVSSPVLTTAVTVERNRRHQSPQESSGADAAGEDGELHGCSSSARRYSSIRPSRSCPGESADVAIAGFDQTESCDATRQDGEESRGEALRRVTVDQCRRRAGDLRDRSVAAGDDRRADRLGFEDREPESLVEAGVGEHRCMANQPVLGVVVDRAEAVDAIADHRRERLDRGRDLGRLVAGSSGQHELCPCIVGGEQPEGSHENRQRLASLLRPDRDDEWLAVEHGGDGWGW